jgi:hypothetical protein
MEDVEGTKQASVSALRTFFFDDFVVPVLSATEFHATSAYFAVTDITRYELSGFNVLGRMGINEVAPKSSLHINTTDQIIIPRGTTGERASLADEPGGLRYNTTLKTFEGNKGTADGGWASLGDTTTSILATETIGGVDVGYIFPANTSLQAFITKLFSKVFNPTLIPPTIVLTTSRDNIEIEVGSQSLRVTVASSNRGDIIGSNDPALNGAWNPSRRQSDRTGAPLNFYIEDQDTGATNFRDITHIFTEGNNTFEGGVNYQAGPTPLNSAGVASGQSAWSAGNYVVTRTLVARRRLFFVADANGSQGVPTLGSDIRAFATAPGGGYVHGPNTNTVFNINIPIGANRILFAFPNSIAKPGGVQNQIKVEYVEDGFTDQTSEFQLFAGNVFVGGVNNNNAVLYNIYSTFPLLPFTDTATFRVTIL